MNDTYPSHLQVSENVLKKKDNKDNSLRNDSFSVL